MNGREEAGERRTLILLIFQLCILMNPSDRVFIIMFINIIIMNV